MAEKQKIYNYRERFEHICNQYAYVFGKKHGLPEFSNEWVANRVGDVAYYGNVMVNKGRHRREDTSLHLGWIPKDMQRTAATTAI